MQKEKIDILVAKGYVGYCENNSKENSYCDKNVSRRKRIEKLFAPNGLPVKSWWHFVNKYYGIYKYRNVIMPYIKAIIAIMLKKDIT